MKMITEDEYDRLHHKTTNVKQVNESFFHKANRNATDILESKDIPDDIKLQLYGSVMSTVKNQLHQILNKPINVNLSVTKSTDINDSALASSTNLSDQFVSFASPSNSPEKLKSPFQPSPASHNQFDISDEDSKMLGSIPENFKTKTYDLVRILKQYSSFINWDDKGRVTFFGDEFCPDSNLVDLLTYTLRDVKFDEPPAGVNRFLRILKIINVPHFILSKEARKGFLGHLHQMPIKEGNPSRVSGIANWDPIRSADRHSFQTPKDTRTPNTRDVTNRKRRNK